MEDGYATDLLAEKSYEFIDHGAKSAKPFSIMIATVAPHANIGGGGKEGDAEDAGYDDNGLSVLSQGEGNAPIALFRLQARGLRMGPNFVLSDSGCYLDLGCAEISA